MEACQMTLLNTLIRAQNFTNLIEEELSASDITKI